MKKVMATMLLSGFLISVANAHIVMGKPARVNGIEPYVNSVGNMYYEMHGATVAESMFDFRCKNNRKGTVVIVTANNFLTHVENERGQVATRFYKNKQLLSAVKEYCR